jgi:hypothetical protein
LKQGTEISLLPQRLLFEQSVYRVSLRQRSAFLRLRERIRYLRPRKSIAYDGIRDRSHLSSATEEGIPVDVVPTISGIEVDIAAARITPPSRIINLDICSGASTTVIHPPSAISDAAVATVPHSPRHSGRKSRTTRTAARRIRTQDSTEQTEKPFTAAAPKVSKQPA